ncbi:LLM class flavin-dependent oxidoreductase [Tsukamurella tyrosinosolvens]|uniref:LLM class flavin-dependent oxidoreductase n=1 Tax=Tsukamurella tyrosinosolvens TaxID=57704 RepID=UPI001AFA831E|nr:LLM class flavin-dependent oxidoreductase [Tsukamurella tyrosinosolvens]MEC4616474.1 LLM class flavin-dependent oxidoreductase [Tsukamurella tyrosinosolvens]QRY82667.1 LLM class flavin-dependent oxidoreductase [Tsukamurella tyrosinosolvens]
MTAASFSVSIPQILDGDFDAAGVRDYLVRAEELGFEGAWTSEQTVGGAAMLAPLELLSWAAACTSRLRLGVAVIVSSLHDPLQLAAAATSVDRLSHGRLDLGVGSGGDFRPFAAFGVARETFIASYTEGIELMKAAWADDPIVTFHGRFRDADGVSIPLKPVQRPHPPLWFGGGAPKALARAVRLGDGFMGAGSSTTAHFRGAVAAVREELAGQGRDDAGFRIGKRVYLVVDDDADRARRAADEGLFRIYGALAARFGDVAVTGTAEQVADGLREVVDAGAQTILLNPMGFDVAADREQLERLHAEVLPLLG